jgi:hypothetical protein
MSADFQTLSLHRISELPFDADAEIFRRYPGFKLGVVPCVNYYAELMLPMVREVITNSPEYDDWILTAPAITAQTPAAANLMSWKLFDLYMHQLDAHCSTKLSLIDIEHDRESTWADWKDPAKPQDYARLDFADRLTEHERISRRLTNNADFQGRPVLFVNDIRVTGAQQHAMQNYFEQAGAACVRWLYIIVVDPEIGRAEPRIEWKINFAPFEELLRMVSTEQIQFTGKCVQRLMGLTLVELDQVLRALDAQRRRRLFELATRNGFENLNDRHEQMELVRSFCE